LSVESWDLRVESDGYVWRTQLASDLIGRISGWSLLRKKVGRMDFIRGSGINSG
jgi:hypothetical protein